MQIETVRDLEFDKNYDYEKTKIIVKEEPLFSFLKLELPSNSTFNILIRDKKLVATLPTPSTLLFAKEESDPLFDHSLDDDSLPSPQKLTKIYYEPTYYSLVAQHIVFFSYIQSKICESLSYHKAI